MCVNFEKHIFAGKNVLPYFPLKNVQKYGKNVLVGSSAYRMAFRAGVTVSHGVIPRTVVKRLADWY